MHLIADETQVNDLIRRLTAESAALTRAAEGPWAIVGIRSRGDILAHRLADEIQPAFTGSVDIALYRDDLSEVGPQPVVRTTEINFPLDGTNILLVDDVLMTGRSIRAAIQSLLDYGRPRCIRLLVLVDRGGRELPIAPDLVGQRLNLDHDQLVEVRLRPQDPDDRIVRFEKPAAAAAREEH
ncbi:MAG: bifunctional pyr operon transcriptional regulator/uracil phosphoribosyltransferase PyrR [Phycisphaerae bacterium]|nr:bifunctional pyr operon transcriptional regulator/uracil phosphoribosyltransferase PyrR [Phycisphaerae bacterium]